MPRLDRANEVSRFMYDKLDAEIISHVRGIPSGSASHKGVLNQLFVNINSLLLLVGVAVQSKLGVEKKAQNSIETQIEAQVKQTPLDGVPFKKLDDVIVANASRVIDNLTEQRSFH